MFTKPCASESHRRLPHVYIPEKWLFLTWHLHGSLPNRYPPPHKVSAGQAFVWIDRQLDTTRAGPMYLRRPEIALLVANSLQKGVDLGHYVLGSWVVMPNHVHVLLKPQIDPIRLLRSLKGVTSREANRLLRRTGDPFWQHESYDHYIRNETEWSRISAYIENNPVKAGLATKPEDYLWSSANARWR